MSNTDDAGRERASAPPRPGRASSAGAQQLTAAEAQEKYKDLIRKQVLLERIKTEARDQVAAERAAARARRTALVFDGEEDLRPTEYLVDGVIPAEGAGMLFGESDVGKTFTAVSLGVHVAAGTEWMGHDVKLGTVLFVESEGGRAFALRKHAAKGAAGLGDGRKLGFAALPFVTSYTPLGFGPDTDLEVVVANAATVRREVEAKELPPIRLVVVDTLMQNMVGDADNNEEMTAFLRAFRAFLKALSAEPVVGLVIHHPGHAEKDRARGAYSLAADLDLVMHLEGDGTDSLTLTCKRMRDGTRFAPIPLRLEKRVVTVDGEPLRDSRGREQTALVVVMQREQSGANASPADPVEAAVLEALPSYPKKAGVQAVLVPKVSSILGRSIGKEKVSAACYTLEKKGLAESGPGTRGKDTLVWGRAAPKAQAEPGDM